MNAVPALSATDLTQWVLLLALMALAPFVLAMVTSFVKIVVVTSVLRTALGVQQIPPSIVVTGIAMLLTAHVMWPVGSEIVQRYQQATPRTTGGLDFDAMRQALVEPLGSFLSRHADARNVQLFQDLKQRLATVPGAAPAGDQPPPAADDLVALITVVAPAFVLTELTEAFQIAFLIFIPFLIVDLCVSNVLMALGLQYLQPTVVSLPLKLLLFVLVDGWRLILEGVLLGYAET